MYRRNFETILCMPRSASENRREQCIVESGDKSLALKLEEHGYAWIAERQMPEKIGAGTA